MASPQPDRDVGVDVTEIANEVTDAGAYMQWHTVQVELNEDVP